MALMARPLKKNFLRHSLEPETAVLLILPRDIGGPKKQLYHTNINNGCTGFIVRP